MRRETGLFSIVAVTGIAFLAGHGARADVYYWMGTGIEAGWCSEYNWFNYTDPIFNGYPDDADDTAIVGEGTYAGCAVIREDIVVGELVIEGDGCVTIDGGCTLTITDSGGDSGRLTIKPPAGTLTIGDGTVELDARCGQSTASAASEDRAS